MEANKKRTILILLAFFAIYVIWGSTYLLNKIAVTELPAFMLAGIRFFIAGLLLFGLAKLLGIPMAISTKQFVNTIIAGFLFLTFGNGIVVWALKFVDSGFAALVISAQPLVIILLMRFLQGKKIQAMSLVGVGLGILGIYLLVSQKAVIAQEGAFLGTILIFLCMISWAYGSLFVGKAELPLHYLVNTGYQMLSGGISMMLISLAIGEQWSSPLSWSVQALWSMVLLILFGSVVAFTSFNFLLREVSPEKVATSTYVNPVIAMLLGWYFLGETITLQSVVAAIILLTGVYFINTKKKLTLFSRFISKRNMKRMTKNS
jgi:drug/metabolite transporter (DMT)-like permease